MKKSGDSKGNILIVDDTPANLRLLSNMLTERTYKVRAVINGQMALMATRAALPDLILLDITMPGMSGYEVCEQLKSDPVTRDIPVIFISALDETQDKVKAFAVGGVDYITKPFQFEEVLARVETHLALRDMQRQLQEANGQLVRQVEELNAFAHTVAHDLKNPLGGMLGYAEMLLEDLEVMDADEVRHSVQGIINTGRQMDRIIKELLLLARLRNEELDLAPLDMALVLGEVQQRLEYMISQYNAQLHVTEVWPAALGHGPWVEEIWVNYITNALKYGGKPPQVELGYTLLPVVRPGDRAMARFWVRDNGIGIAPESQARLFTPFTRVHQTRAEGEGLGLSIVQRIVEKLGGHVGVESDVGKGSVFSFTLPLALTGATLEREGTY